MFVNVSTMQIKASKPAPAESSKPIERLTAIANGLFSQVDCLKSGTYIPSEVQQVRKTAVTLRNAVSNLLAQNEVPSNPKLVSIGVARDDCTRNIDPNTVALNVVNDCV